MKPLPMPLRLAAGLVATAIEEVQELPRKLVELPVTAVSQVLQASMRMQQRVTELAIKGDQALGGLRPVPETPTWARFDEDEMDSPYGGGGGPFGGGTDHPFGSVDRPYGSNGVAGVPSDSDWNVPPPRSAPRTVSPIRIARDPEPDDFGDDEFDDLDFTEARGPENGTGTGTEPSTPPESTTRAPARPASTKPPTKPASKPPASKPADSKPASKAAASKSSAKSKPPAAPKAASKPAASKPAASKPPAKSAADKSGAAKSAPDKSGAAKSAPDKSGPARSDGGKTAEGSAEPTAAEAAKSSAAPKAETGPRGHEDYPSWTLPQLRGRFRSLELKDVQALLDWETSHLDRPPYVTMLSNRIASITGR